MHKILITYALLMISCSSPTFENPCDIRSKTILSTIALKISSRDTTSVCGYPMSLFTFSSGPISVSYAENIFFKNNQFVSYPPTVSGNPTEYSVSPSFPNGVTIDKITGVISGTYSKFEGSRTQYSISASNAFSSSTSLVTISFYGKPPLKTSQTQCWNNVGTLDATCGIATSTGQDGALQKGTSPDFNSPTLVGADYITKDNLSGVVWHSCNDGRTGATCTLGGYNQPDWASAITNCSNLNSANSGFGYALIKTWRLPTPEELETLVNFSTTGPATFTTNFPNTVPGANTWHWTSLSDPSNAANAWWVYFTDGQMGPIGTKSTAGQYYVRCVSDGTSVSSNSIFLDNKDGTVTDINRSLVWQKCSIGQSATDCSGTATTSTWANSLLACNSLTLAGKSWRLPNINELKTLIDRRTATFPAIQSKDIFLSTPNSEYWSSTTDLGTPATGNAWVTLYNGGTVFQATKAATNKYTRCVSDP